MARHSRSALFLAIVVFACLVRLGYGAVRFQGSLDLTGQAFIHAWRYDALEHVLIAKSLIEEGAYRLGPPPPELESVPIRWSTHDALFKAPLYQYFLAGVFALSGFNFALFFPLQALIGGIASGLVALIALEAFGSRRVALLAGAAAAVHPVLVHTASQPYNENLFLALLAGSVWAFARWLRSPRIGWALACGAIGGLAILCRESAIPVVAAMAAWAVAIRPAGARPSMAGACALIVSAAAIVAPWTARNFVRTGRVIPVASVTGTVLSLGNNGCLADEPLFRWYWAEGPCVPLNAVRDRLIARYPEADRDDTVIRNGINADLAIQFIRDRPRDYARLTLRRAWTIGLPFHPWQQLSTVQRSALTAYWLLVVPLGLLGLVSTVRSSRLAPAEHGAFRLPGLLALLVAAVIVPQILMYFSPDMRHRILADLLLGCFAAHVYVRVVDGALRRRRKSDTSAPAEASA